MPVPFLTCCGSSGLLATAIVTILLLPTSYYIPELYSGFEAESPILDIPDSPNLSWFEQKLQSLPPFDNFITVILIILGIATYLCEWVQRKLMEKRIQKLNQYLEVNVERFRAWDAQQEQLEATLKMVQNSTYEYNLLLYLLLRQHNCLPNGPPPPNCMYDKEFEDISFLRPIEI